MTIIDQLLEQTANHQTLLNVSYNGSQAIAIHQHGHYRWLYTGGRSIQSILCLDTPAQLYLANQNMMLVALLLKQNPGRILNLGFGGGSFERFFHARQPDIELVSLDINAPLVALSKAYLQVPVQWPVLIQPAEDYLQQHRQPGHKPFELILCDIFNVESHADCLNEALFYANAAQNLSADGVMAVNLAPQSDQQLIHILRLARQHFAGVMVSKVAKQRNVVLLVSNRPLPTPAQLQSRATALAAQWQLDFSQWLRGFKPLP